MKKQFFPMTKGFTLVELLIVITIMIIFTGIGIFGLRNFTESRNVTLVAGDFASAVRLAKARAQSQVKPTTPECTNRTLDGYRLTLTSSGNRYVGYTINPICSNQVSPMVRQGSFPNALTVTATHTAFTFRTVNGVVEYSGGGNGPAVVTFRDANNQNTAVTIYQDGRVVGGS